MEVHTFLLQLVIILFFARIMGELFSYLKIPAVLGELVAGILIGPTLFGWVEATAPIYLLAQIGVILLLFEVGVETDVGRLTQAGMQSSLVALTGVVLPFVFGFGICYYFFTLSMMVSLFVGSALTATSIGITVRVLQDLKKNKSSEAQVILGAAVLDDVIGIIILAMLYDFAVSGVVSTWNALQVLICVILFFILGPLCAKGIAHVIQKWEEKTSIAGLLPTAMISLILFFAWVASSVGAPELLGGFAAGLAISRKFALPFFRSTSTFSHKVESQMKPIIHLFTPIFFVSIGLSLDLASIDWSSSFLWSFTAVVFILAIIGKFFSGAILFGQKWKSRLMVGIAMIPRGEVGLIFASIGKNTGVLNNDLYASLVLVMALTTLLPPLVLQKVCKMR
jgi:Kef-type K+ transport system membrane component KefB